MESIKSKTNILILIVKKKHHGLFSESTFMRKYFLSNTFDGLCSVAPVQLQGSRIIWFIININIYV